MKFSSSVLQRFEAYACTSVTRVRPLTWTLTRKCRCMVDYCDVGNVTQQKLPVQVRMWSLEALKLLISQRLSAAVDDILGHVYRTIRMLQEEEMEQLGAPWLLISVGDRRRGGEVEPAEGSAECRLMALNIQMQQKVFITETHFQKHKAVWWLMLYVPDSCCLPYFGLKKDPLCACCFYDPRCCYFLISKEVEREKS